MNYSLLTLEFMVLGLGLGLLLVDLWLPAERKRSLGYAAALGLILLYSFSMTAGERQFAFGKMYVFDGLALFFKRFSLLAAFLVLLIAVEFSNRTATTRLRDESSRERFSPKQVQRAPNPPCAT